MLLLSKYVTNNLSTLIFHLELEYERSLLSTLSVTLITPLFSFLLLVICNPRSTEVPFPFFSFTCSLRIDGIFFQLEHLAPVCPALRLDFFLLVFVHRPSNSYNYLLFEYIFLRRLQFFLTGLLSKQDSSLYFTTFKMESSSFLFLVAFFSFFFS